VIKVRAQAGHISSNYCVKEGGHQTGGQDLAEDLIEEGGREGGREGEGGSDNVSKHQPGGQDLAENLKEGAGREGGREEEEQCVRKEGWREEGRWGRFIPWR